MMGTPQPLVSRAGRFLAISESSFTGVAVSSNVYVTESEGSYYVFDASGRPDLLSFLEIIGIPGGYIGGIFLTHGHYDHVMGLESLAKLDIPTFIAKSDMGLVRASVNSAKMGDMDQGKVLLKSIGIIPIPTPGHTPGGICFYSEADNLLISGDTVFSNGYFGRTDLEGGNDTDLIRSLRLLDKLKISFMLPGHGDFLIEGGSGAVKAALTNALVLLNP